VETPGKISLAGSFDTKPQGPPCIQKCLVIVVRVTATLPAPLDLHLKPSDMLTPN